MPKYRHYIDVNLKMEKVQSGDGHARKLRATLLK